ncbi:MAG: beta-phosphoglucomutase family hydrolase [Actinomycetota bacterium]|nr:beta-phosphoglucomutase family hydrolase [Actinomycetota bacterium]
MGLPAHVAACLFDLDGVLTQTAKLHAAAWKTMFDAFLRSQASSDGKSFVVFDKLADYNKYVDGKPREDGVRSFLDSRDIKLPGGTPDDPPDADTIHGLGNRKNELLLRLVHEQGVESYEGSVSYVKAAREAGLARAVVSSSANCHEMLEAADMTDLFDEVIDGVVAERDHLKGKPAPDTFLAAARALGTDPGRAAVFEDALAGVAAGKAGGFAYVIGVDRVGHADALLQHGADRVVRDLSEMLPAP